MKKFRQLLSPFASGGAALAALVAVLSFAVAVRAQEPEVYPGHRPERVKRAGGLDAERKADSQRKSVEITQPKTRPKAFGLLDKLETVRAKKFEAKAAPSRDALDDVLDRIGGVRAWYAMGSMRLERSLTGLDASGAMLFEHEFQHESRTGFGPAHDRIQWSSTLAYGRRSGRIWARSSGIERPDLEQRARGEIERWSTMAHFPFALRDRDRFVVDGKKVVRIHGRELTRVRVSVRGTAARPHGPEAPAIVQKRERWDLFVDANTGLPILTEHYHPVSGTRRILLGLWRRVGADGLRLPFERTLLAEDGESPRLLVRLRIL